MSEIKPLKDLHSRNNLPETDYVAGHVLCERCSRIRDKSAILKGLAGDDYQPGVFFHSRNLRQLLESSAAGCHLCTILFQRIDLGRVEHQTDDGGGIVARCWSMPLPSAPSGVFCISLRRLNQNGQAATHAEGDYSRIEGLLVAGDYNVLTYPNDIGEAWISEIDGTKRSPAFLRSFPWFG